MTATALTGAGAYEFLWDDDTGIGLFMLCIFPTLIIQSVRRLLASISGDSTTNTDGQQQQHPVWSRPCHQQDETAISQEQQQPHAVTPHADATKPSDDAAASSSQRGEVGGGADTTSI